MSTYVNLRSILDTNKLIGPNFLDWLRNLRIVLKAERINYALDEPLPKSPTVESFERVQRAYHKHLVDNVWARCVMLTSMSPELQKQYMVVDAHNIVLHPMDLFYEQV